MIEIWSGGQTGVDQGALEGAEDAGIKTGGWIPRGHKTEDGPRPDLTARFGLQETQYPVYPQRTAMNVRDTDATLWIGDPESRGGRVTMTAAEQFKRPVFLLSVANMTESHIPGIKHWLGQNNVKRLNVAGHRESSNKGIQARTRAFIKALIK